MPYEALRSGIRNGDLIAWQGTSSGARLVRGWTRSLWSHVALACWWGPRLFVLESYPGPGTRAHFLSHDLAGAFWIPTGAHWSNAAQDFAFSNLDARYSWLNDLRVAFGLRCIQGEFECAQYAADVLAQDGFQGLPVSPTPGNLVKTFIGRGAVPVWLSAGFVDCSA
jgi:hypothetical protein